MDGLSGWESCQSDHEHQRQPLWLGLCSVLEVGVQGVQAGNPE